MAEPQINILLQSFSGLGLPSTLCIPLPADCTIEAMHTTIRSRLPSSFTSRYILTTSSNTSLPSPHSLSASSPISTLLPPLSSSATLLPLRLTLPLCGGKGGFGSQLRAAGGRMSSKRRRRDQGENAGSNRNLDGRRLRTVAEAKALAEYLAVKPEMERREKEARRKRWEQIVQMAEDKEREIKSGSKGRVDGQWVADLDDAKKRTEMATRAAMAGEWSDRRFSNHDNQDMSGSDDEEESGEGEQEEMDSSEGTTPEVEDDKKAKAKAKAVEKILEKGVDIAKTKDKARMEYFGFDEDDEFMSEDEEEAAT